MNFDGSQFYGIDDSATGEDAPVDTALVHYLVNSLRFFQRGRDRAGLPLLCRVADYAEFDPESKIIAGANAMWWHATPLVFSGTPERVRIDILQTVNDFFDGADALIEVTARIEPGDGSPAVEERILLDDDSNRRERLVLEFGGADFSGAATLYLGVEAKEVQVDTADAFEVFQRDVGSIAVQNIPPASSAPEYNEGDPDKPQPSSAGAMHPAVTSTTNLTREVGTDHLLFLGEVGDRKDMAIHATQTLAGFPGNGATFMLPWLNVGAIHLEVDYRSRFFEPEELRSNIVEKTEVASRISAAQEEILTAPRLASIGTVGEYGSTSDRWPVGHRKSWAKAGPDEGVGVEVIRESVAYQKLLSGLEVRLLVYGVDMSESRFPALDDPDRVVERLERFRSLNDWESTIHIDQWRDGSLDRIASTGGGQTEITHYPASVHRALPMTTQIYHRQNADDGDGDRYTYREGQMTGADVQLLQTLTVEAQIPENIREELSGRGDPFDVVVELEPVGDTRRVWTNNSGWAEVSRAEQEIFLYVIGHSIYTRRSP